MSVECGSRGGQKHDEVVPRSDAATTHRWQRGVVVSGVHRIIEVNPRQARLVPGWVTVFGRVCDLSM